MHLEFNKKNLTIVPLQPYEYPRLDNRLIGLPMFSEDIDDTPEIPDEGVHFKLRGGEKIVDFDIMKFGNDSRDISESLKPTNQVAKESVENLELPDGFVVDDLFNN